MANSSKPIFWSLRASLFLLTGIFVCCLLISRWMSWWQLQIAEAHSPLNQRVSDYGEFRAEFLPPPLFVVESYLMLHRMVDEPSLEVRKLWARQLQEHEEEFESRDEHWRARLESSEMLDLYENEIRTTANQFFEIVNRDLGPKICRDEDPEPWRDILLKKVTPIYESHREAIVRLGHLVEEETRKKEEGSREVIQRWELWQSLIGIALVLFFATASWFISLGILRLQEQKDRMAMLPGFSGSAFLIADQDSNVTWVNDGFSILSGISNPECIGRNLLELITEGQIDPSLRRSVQESLKNGEGCRFELNLKRSNGREYTCDTEVQTARGSNGKPNGLIAVQYNTTEQATLRRRLQSMFHSLSEGIVFHDRSGKIIDCNTAATRILGLTREQLMNRSSTDPRWTCYRESGEPWEGSSHPAMLTLKSGRAFHDVVMAVGLADGAKRWISINTEPILDDSGHVEAVVSSFSDISKLRGKNQRLDLMVQSASLGTWEWNWTTQRVRLEGAYHAIMGLHHENVELSAIGWKSFIHPQDLKKVEASLELHLNGQSPEYRSEHRVRGRDGNWVWLLESGRIVERDSDGTPRTLIGIAIDISAEKLLQLKVRDSERKLRVMLDTALYAVISFDVEGVVTGWNMTAEAIFGWSAAEAINRSLSDLIVPEYHRDNPENGILKYLSSRETQIVGKRIEAIAARKDGTRITVESAISPVFTEHTSGLSEVTSFTAFMRDITVERRLETQLVESKKLESIGHLAAGVAHEINTPVQFVNDSVHFVREGIHDLIELIEHYQSISASVREGTATPELATATQDAELAADLDYLLENLPSALDRSIDGLDRIAGIVRSMKEFAHRGTADRSLYDVNRAIANILTIAKSEYRSCAEVELELSELPEIMCIASEVNQAILNFIVNAAHAIEMKVKVSGERGVIRITTRCVDKEVEIAISDTGIGIPKKDLERIFDPFFSTKGVGVGTGQGLAIAQNIIVGNHGGSIFVDSRVGVGSTFRIQLPIRSETFKAYGAFT